LFFNLSYGGPWPVLKTILEITISFSILIISFFFLITTLFLINFLNNYLSPFYITNHPVIHPSIRLVIHPSRHGLFTRTGQRKSGIQTQHGGQSKGRRETSFHPSVPSFIHPSVPSSIRPVMVCLLQWGGERVEYRRDVTSKCTIKYTHTCALGTGFKLVHLYILSHDVSDESAGHIHGWKKEGFCPQSKVNVKWHTIEVSIKVSEHAAPVVGHFYR